MVFSPQLIENARRSITQQPGSLADENKNGCALARCLHHDGQAANAGNFGVYLVAHF
jgi:hypothetical protein